MYLFQPLTYIAESYYSTVIQYCEWLTNFIARAVIKSAATLMPILGVTWIFGLLVINEDTEVFAWIFTVLNTLQVC